jgi:NDP-sugar pyrophosphorylase family protein
VPDGDRLLGTGGAIAAVLPTLPSPFWVTYGDTLLEVAMAPIEARLTADADGLVVVVRNTDAGQPSNTSIEGDRVVAYGKGAPPGTHDHLDYGLLLLRREAFDGFAPGSAFDLGVVLQRLVAERRLLAHVVAADYHDVGTPEAWEATGRHYGDG